MTSVRVGIGLLGTKLDTQRTRTTCYHGVAFQPTGSWRGPAVGPLLESGKEHAHLYARDGLNTSSLCKLPKPTPRADHKAEAGVHAGCWSCPHCRV